MAFTLNFCSILLTRLNPDLFGLRLNFLLSFIPCWLWLNPFENWRIWNDFFILLPVLGFPIVLLDLLNDVPNFPEGSELLHMMATTLNGISSLEKFRHGFENFVNSKHKLTIYFGLCLDWRSYLKKSMKTTYFIC